MFHTYFDWWIRSCESFHSHGDKNIRILGTVFPLDRVSFRIFSNELIRTFKFNEENKSVKRSGGVDDGRG